MLPYILPFSRANVIDPYCQRKKTAQGLSISATAKCAKSANVCTLQCNYVGNGAKYDPLLLFANRKSHAVFRLVDLERL